VNILVNSILPSHFLFVHGWPETLACNDYFIWRVRKVLKEGFLLVKFKSSLRKFYGRHCGLVDRFGMSVSQMTTDMLFYSL
jgi:hypothetical protein